MRGASAPAPADGVPGQPDQGGVDQKKGKRMTDISIPDGGYYLFDSDGWSYVIFRANRVRTMTEAANLATHQAARDHFSDLDPDLNSPTDDTGRESDRVVLDPDLAAAIVMEVHGHDDPSEIWVVRER